MEKGQHAFSQFRQQIKKRTQYANGDEIFLGRVVYCLTSQTLQETLTVRLGLTTIGHGSIALEEGNVINSDIVHMDFTYEYQNYEFEHVFLIISGKSSRLGSYEVRISEE